jgi:hypothetical protein
MEHAVVHVLFIVNWLILGLNGVILWRHRIDRRRIRRVFYIQQQMWTKIQTARQNQPITE